MRENFQFIAAITKINGMIESIRNKKDEVANDILNDTRNDIIEEKELFDQKIEEIQILEEIIEVYKEYDNFKAIEESCTQAINLANQIERTDLILKFNQILKEANRKNKEIKIQKNNLVLEEEEEFEEQNDLENYKNGIIQITKMEGNIKQNQLNGNFKAVAKDCQKIIKIAKSIKSNDLTEKYTEILNEINSSIEGRNRKEQTLILKSENKYKKKKEIKKTEDTELLKQTKEEIRYYPILNIRFLIIVMIFGAALMIIASIFEIIFLFSIIYRNINLDMGIETADTIFIFLYSNCCISIIGGILIILGSLEVNKNKFTFGKSFANFGAIIGTISSTMYLIVGIWASFLSKNVLSSMISIIIILFVIGLSGSIITIISILILKNKLHNYPPKKEKTSKNRFSKMLHKYF